MMTNEGQEPDAGGGPAPESGEWGEPESALVPPPLTSPDRIGPDPAAPTWQIVLSLAWPVLAQQLLILAVALSDQYIAGNFPPPDRSLHVAYQSAQTTAIYLAWLINSYAFLVSIGSTALVARFVGAREPAAAIRVTNQAILLAVFLGLLGTFAGLLSLDPLIAVLQLHGPAAEFAKDYLRPLFALLTFPILETAGIACLIGAGDTRTGLKVLGGVAVVNVPLAWGLFLGWGPLPALGFAGISLGTALSHVLAALAVLIVLARGRAGLRLRWRELWPDWGLLRRLLRISLPAGLDGLSSVLCQLWFLSIINQLSAAESGAHGIALRLEALAYLSGGAFGTAAMALVGQNLGARRPDWAVRSGWLAFGLGGVVMCLMGAVFFILAPQMFALFCPNPEQRPVIDAGVPVLRLVAFATPAMASTFIFTAALRGAGDTRVPLLFTWIGFLGVRIPLAYYLTGEWIDLGWLGTWKGWNLGLFGAWLAMVADITVRGGFFLYRFRSGRWQKIRV
jgi:putative MATE family efflux protein